MVVILPTVPGVFSNIEVIEPPKRELPKTEAKTMKAISGGKTNATGNTRVRAAPCPKPGSMPIIKPTAVPPTRAKSPKLLKNE